MNENGINKRKFQQAETDEELDWQQLLYMISALADTARARGAYAVLTQLEAMRKSMVRSNINKKIIRATQAKYEKLRDELNQKTR